MVSLAFPLALCLAQGAVNGIASEYRDFPRISSAASEALNVFVSHSSLKERNSQSLFSLDARNFAEVNREIGRRVTSKELDTIRGESVEHLSLRIGQAADSVLGGQKRPANANLVSYVYAYAIVCWVRTHIFFDARDESVWRMDQRPILDRPVPATICGGSSWLCASLGSFSRKTVLLKVEGRLRGHGGAGKPDHSWEVLRLPSDDVLFADAQHSRLSLRAARTLDGYLDHPLCFGLSRESRTLFGAARYQMNEVEAVVDWSVRRANPRIIPVATDPYTNLSIDQWAALRASALDSFRYRPGDAELATWHG